MQALSGDAAELVGKIDKFAVKKPQRAKEAARSLKSLGLSLRVLRRFFKTTAGYELYASMAPVASK